MLKLRRGLSSLSLKWPVLRCRVQHKKSNAAAINVTNAVITTARTTVFLLLCLSSSLLMSEDGEEISEASSGGVNFGKNDVGGKGCEGL